MIERKKTILSLVFLTALVVLISGCGCKQKNVQQYSLALEIWGPLDSRDILDSTIENYKSLNPNIASIVYKKISPDTYEKELNDALASGQGPDIFMINNRSLNSYFNKIVPAPSDQYVLNEQKFRNNFVDTVIFDFLEKEKIYAVPLSVDSLGLYYNKALFNQAGISSPPTNWNEFIEDVRKLRKINDFNEIIQAGAAIGTAYNINRSTDILNLLMLQSNTEMIDKNGRINFDSSVSSISGNRVSPGEEALLFYTQFAKSGSLNYTWNPTLHYSLDAFSEGTLAMMFNYSWHIKTILDKAPKLNFAIAPIPQFENGNKVNYANYWGYTVAKNKTPQSQNYGNSPAVTISNDARIAESWRFLTYLTTKPDGTFVSSKSSGLKVGKQVNINFDPAEDYLIKSGEPAARRDLIEKQKNDPLIGIFAVDNLIAKSWKQSDPDAIEIIFEETIDQVNRGQATVSEALKTAAQRVSLLQEKKLN